VRLLDAGAPTRGRRCVAWKKDFVRLMAERYRAPWQPVDFRQDADAARTKINRWVEQETRDRIRELLLPGSLDAMTELVLTNAAYFYGAWVEPFDARMTRDGAFATPGGSASTRFMWRDGATRYAQLDGLQIVELPYKGGFSMLVVLPDDPRGLAAVESRLPGGYQRWVRALAEEQVEILLPRWRAESTQSLNDHLEKLGMRHAFSDGADFSGMIDSGSLQISAVIQKAFIEVTETGTEAAAATAVVLGGESVEPPRRQPRPFHADHPFLYVVRDQETGAILFMGRVVNPGT
jgi:serpin B